MKNWLKGILCFLFVACLGATVHAKTLKLGHVCSKDHSYQVASDYFAKRIAAETDGKIKVKVYPNAALGDEDTLVEGLQLGTVHLAVAAPGKLEGFVKELGIFGLPFLFRSMEHKYKVLDGEIGATMTKIIESRIPVKVLGYWQSGVRHLFNSKRPVYSPEDLKGIKIRVMPGPVHRAVWKELGAIPAVVAFPEIYSALKAGVLDAAENDFANILQMKFYESCPYISLTEHTNTVRLFLTSKRLFDSYPTEIQAKIVRAGKESTDVNRKEDNRQVEEALKILVDKYGAKVNEVDKGAFVTKESKVKEQLARDIGVLEMVEAIEAVK